MSRAADTNSAVRSARDRSLALLLDIAARTEPLSRGEDKLVLIIQYFHSSDDAVREALIDTLTRNLADPGARVRMSYYYMHDVMV